MHRLMSTGADEKGRCVEACDMGTSQEARCCIAARATATHRCLFFFVGHLAYQSNYRCHSSPLRCSRKNHSVSPVLFGLALNLSGKVSLIARRSRSWSTKRVFLGHESFVIILTYTSAPGVPNKSDSRVRDWTLFVRKRVVAFSFYPSVGIGTPVWV